LNPNVAVLELPRVATDPAAGILSRTKRWVERWRNDGGRRDVLVEYRSALAAASPHPALIGYDAFSLGPKAEPDRYRPDGIHLTDPNFHKLGAYLGQALPLPLPTTNARPSLPGGSGAVTNASRNDPEKRL
jgi:hypothetical protein